MISQSDYYVKRTPRNPSLGYSRVYSPFRKGKLALR